MLLKHMYNSEWAFCVNGSLETQLSHDDTVTLEVKDIGLKVTVEVTAALR